MLKILCLLSLVCLLSINHWVAPKVEAAYQFSGRVTTTQNIERYQVIAQIGDVMRVKMTRTSGDLIPYLAIWDPSQERFLMRGDLTNTTRQTTLEFEFTSGGLYEIYATHIPNEGGLTFGEFVISIDGVQAYGNAANPLRQPPGVIPMFTEPIIILSDSEATITGRISNTHFSQYYMVFLPSNQTYTLETHRLEGTLNTFVLQRSLDSDRLNRGVINADGSSAVTFTTQTSSWYIIIMTRESVDAGNTEGLYQLVIRSN